MSIATERAALFAQGLDITHRETWGAVQSYTSPRPVERARWLFLHIAVVDDPNDLVGTEHEVMRNIERIGQARFGIGCSYNAAAFDTGRLYEAQPLGRRGAHTVNDLPNRDFPYHPDGRGFSLNHLARALVLPQDVDDDVTDEQIDAAARWGAALCRAGFAVPRAPWFGHRDVTQKSCPGPVAYARLEELNRLTRHYEALGLTDQEDDMDAEQARMLKEIHQFVERSHPNGDVKRGDTWATPDYWRLMDLQGSVAHLSAEIAALRSAVGQLGAGGTIDYAKVQEAAETASEAALRKVLGSIDE